MEADRVLLPEGRVEDYTHAPHEFAAILRSPESFDLHPLIFNIQIAFENVLADSDYRDWNTIHSYVNGLTVAIKDGYRSIAYIMNARVPLQDALRTAQRASARVTQLEYDLESSSKRVRRVEDDNSTLRNRIDELMVMVRDRELWLDYRDHLIQELQSQISE
jgi:hypothetical protein